jgi:hypothetical protein
MPRPSQLRYESQEGHDEIDVRGRLEYIDGDVGPTRIEL